MASWHPRQGAATGNGTAVPDFGRKEAEERLTYGEDEDGGVRREANDVRGSSFPLRLTRRSHGMASVQGHACEGESGGGSVVPCVMQGMRSWAMAWAPWLRGPDGCGEVEEVDARDDRATKGNGRSSSPADSWVPPTVDATQ
jgi:hypothetical protein